MKCIVKPLAHTIIVSVLCTKLKDNIIGVGTRGAPGARAPQVFCLFHAHSICPVL